MIVINGMEITDELVKFMKQEKEDGMYAEQKLSEVMDLIIDIQSGALPVDEDGSVFRMMLFDVKGLRDTMRSLRTILETCKITES